MKWTVFKSFDHQSMAELMSERLRSNGVPTRIDFGAYHSGVDGVHLYVASHMLHRARWLTSETALSDEELDYLATGELRGKNSGG
ncbi:MAG: hypothetical protein GY712_10610 [Oceanicoccus sp.]|uniref:hypothetical protein n=1 Tax=Oceanicoccus sp. TaxID=2691044 RepID=UPI00263761CE|nr:hypothetical protein [Oceanicoccus sp.]MCP3908453.1 hypothetical protein [Oceanicoccus sp.]